MQEPRYSTLPRDAATGLDRQLPPNILISLTTVPLLAGLVARSYFADLLQQLGQASEEVFRGDRLPVLKPTVPPSSARTSAEIDS